MKRLYIRWKPVLKRAVEIVNSYDTGVTLRQLFYRLVSEGKLPNTQNYYKTLSDRTAEGRREEWFPDLVDRNRRIEVAQSFESPGEAKQWLSEIYRRDRTEGQEYKVYLGVEKAGMVEQLKAWFWDYGITIFSLQGYASQSLVDRIKADIDERPAILIYAGDFDSTGIDILRDFKNRCPIFEDVIQIALTLEQIDKYGLTEMKGKEKDPRRAGFIAVVGRDIQVELDAIDPDVLRSLYEEAFFKYLDKSILEKSMQQERIDIQSLSRGRVR